MLRGVLIGVLAATLFVGLPTGLVVTEAGNNAWSTAFEDAEQLLHYSFAFKPGDPLVVYAGGISSLEATRVYRSADGGRTWGFTATAEYSGMVLDIEVPKKEPATVYVGTTFGVWKSADDGATWAKASGGLPLYPGTSSLTTTILDLAVDQDNASTVYAATMTDGVYKTTNGGAAWTKVTRGITASLVTIVKIDPTRPATVYASVQGQSSGTVYRSLDAGATWAAIDIGSSDSVTAIAVHPTNPNQLYFGTSAGLNGGRVLRSSDGGRSWASSSFPSGVRSLTAHPSQQTTVWATTTVSGVYRSADSGAAWTAVNLGLEPPATELPATPAATLPAAQLTAPPDGSTISTDTAPAMSFQLPSGHTASVLVIRPANVAGQYLGTLRSIATNVRTGVPATPNTKLFPGTTYAWQVRSGTTLPDACSGPVVDTFACVNDPSWMSTSLWSTFKTPGTPALFAAAIAINPEAANVVWLSTLGTGLQSYTDLSLPLAPPTLVDPPQGTVLTALGTTLIWTNPPGAAQYQIQIMPTNNDGPAVNLIRNAESSYIVSPPVFGSGPYEMLPGMTYTWRVRATAATRPLPENAPEWGQWTEPRTFRTPVRDSSRLKAVAPADNATVTAGVQTLTWDNDDKDVFYYEVQVSGDTRFDADPATASSFVWWNLVHGGVTTPANSYTTPPLKAGQTVYWRVRPRVQGDGTPAAWGPVWKFTTR